MDSVTTPKSATFIRKPCPGFENGILVKFKDDDQPICLKDDTITLKKSLFGKPQLQKDNMYDTIPKLNASGANATMYYTFEKESDGTIKRYIYKKFLNLYSFNKEARILRLLKQDFQEGDNNDDECHIITYETIIRPDKIIKSPYCLTDLLDYLISETPPTLEQGIEIFKDMLQTLNKLHEKGYVHLDIKPDNIVVKCRGPDDITPYFIDFGYTQKLETLQKNAQICGTRGYIDPYFQQTGNISTKTDMWSMGIVLINICFKIPFNINIPITSEKKQDLINQEIESIISAANPPLSEKTKSYLQPCLIQMLQYDPNNRWSASQVLEVLTTEEIPPVDTDLAPTSPIEDGRGTLLTRFADLTGIRDLAEFCTNLVSGVGGGGGVLSERYPKAYRQYKKYRKYKQRYLRLQQQK
jgi:serine/threonine protein kinase